MAENKEIDTDKALEPEVIVEDAPKKTVAAEEGIEGLKEQLKAEKTRREAAEREAREQAAQVHRAKAEVDDTNLQLISNAIETVKGNSISLKSAYAQAMSVGDYNKAADIQLELSTNAAKLLQLENGQRAMAERPKTPGPVADPVEALAAQLTPRSAAWVRAHPECANDPRMYRKMVRAHEDAMDDGLKADTDEYFEAVEARLGIGKRPVNENEDFDDDEGTELAAKAVSRRSSPAAAPVSRSAISSGGTANRVRLNPAQKEAAALSKMTEAEWWAQHLRAQKDPRYN